MKIGPFGQKAVRVGTWGHNVSSTEFTSLTGLASSSSIDGVSSRAGQKIPRSADDSSMLEVRP
jgi:hypothetical protein